VLKTRQQKEKLVLDLLDQNKNTREIAKIAGMSFREIGAIRRNAAKKKEVEEEQTRQQLISSRAYGLFSQCKSLVQVAIDLNIRQPEVDRFYIEYLKMTQLYDLSRICEEVGGNIGALVQLHRSLKAAGIGIPNVIRLLKIANNDLPSVEARYEMLKQDINSLREQKRNLYNQVTTESSDLEYYRVRCQREKANFEDPTKKDES
jgi:hypothetical protein